MHVQDLYQGNSKFIRVFLNKLKGEKKCLTLLRIEKFKLNFVEDEVFLPEKKFCH